MDLNRRCSRRFSLHLSLLIILPGPYEIADYCIENGVQTLDLLCAWLESGEPHDAPFEASTASYWIARLRPLWRSGSDKYTVIICNRTGTERGGYLFMHGMPSIDCRMSNREHLRWNLNSVPQSSRQATAEGPYDDGER